MGLQSGIRATSPIPPQDTTFSEKNAEFAIILDLNGYSGCMEIG